MMPLSEEQLEDLLYDNPWILSFDFERVKRIEGDNGVLGRQVRLGGIGRRLDLLFRERTTDRPVVVELKKGQLHRDDVAQVMEYGGALRFLPEEEQETYREEFGDMLGSPRLLLVGESVSDSARAAAMLAGVELRTFSGDVEEISIEHWQQRLEEVKLLQGSGEFCGLVGRHDLADRVWECLNSASKRALGEPLLSRANSSYRANLWWWKYTHPLCDFVAHYRERWLYGVFEFVPEPDHKLYFNADTFFTSILTRDMGQDAITDAEQRLEEPHRWIDGNPVFEVSKKLFVPENATELEALFVKHLAFAKELADKHLSGV